MYSAFLQLQQHTHHHHQGAPPCGRNRPARHHPWKDARKEAIAGSALWYGSRASNHRLIAPDEVVLAAFDFPLVASDAAW